MVGDSFANVSRWVCRHENAWNAVIIAVIHANEQPSQTSRRPTGNAFFALAVVAVNG